MPSQSTFTTVRTEGGLLPSDLLARVVAGDSELGGLAPTDYGFGPNERLGEVISRLWNDAKTYWEAFKTDQKALGSGETGVSETRDWMLRLLRELGYGRPEFRAAAEEINGRRYPIQHRSSSVPLHILSFQQDIDRAAVAAAGQPRLSPHALLQEYLNASDAALYGIVTNGLRLRLLRDNASITRLAAVDFDLEAMFENSVYADFVLLFLLLHRTRLPQEGQEASACWLEVWRGKAATQGVRALGALRAGVEKAIDAIGNGLLAHAANDALRDRLRRGELTTEAFYAELLRVVYRLIFLFVAEERDLLYPDGARLEMRQRYAEHYSASRLRGVARRFRTDDRHDDLWRSLRVTFDLFAGKREGLDLVALEGLFAADACPDSDAAMLGNNYLAEAILHLSNVRVDRRVRRVNYRDIGAEELGGVYEGLLDSQPRVVVDAPLGQRFALVGSGQRKTTGSYYTPASLVHELIKSALEPVIADRLTHAGVDRGARERALLDISICDAACGSGHFLLAAARRLAAELARLRSQDREPGQNELRRALRDVVRRCIYGVDLNPLAVDLCRLSLWLESQDTGRPLGFLDHHIKLGNSLVGGTPELLAGGIPDGAYDPVSADDKSISSALKKRNREERSNQLRLFGIDEFEWRSQRASLAQQMLSLAMLPEDLAGDVRKVRASYEAYRREQVDPARIRLDTWTAAFFWSLTPQAQPPPTTFDLRVDQAATAGLSESQHVEIARLREAFHFFHWPLEFPEVFERGGFDCVLGNPPWERIKIQELEFFSSRDPQIATAPSKAAREKLIKALETTEAGRALLLEFRDARRGAESSSKFLRESGRLPLTAVGDVNLYAAFAETDRGLLDAHGRTGIIVPTNIVTDDSTKLFFRDLAENGQIASLYDFQNRDLFPGVGHGVMKFSLLTITGQRQETIDLSFFSWRVSHLRDERRHVSLGADDFALFNPNTRTCPIFRTKYDAELTRDIYGRVPILAGERDGVNPWRAHLVRVFDMNKREVTAVARMREQLPSPDQSDYLPVMEAKLMHQYNHRFATYAGTSLDARRKGTPNEVDESCLTDANCGTEPRFWVPRDAFPPAMKFLQERSWLIGYRNFARSTDERTLIATILPFSATDFPMRVMVVEADAMHVSALVANLNSLVLDFVARQKVGATDLSSFIVKQFPVLPPSGYEANDIEFVSRRVLELTYTSWSLRRFGQDLGHEGPPFRWDESRRAVLRAELDAYFACLYGLTRDELRYVLDPQEVHGPDFPGETFRVLKERESKQYGEYRTRRLVLQAWDQLGLEPRNRGGRYEVDSTDKVAASSPRSAQSAPNGKPLSIGHSDRSDLTNPSPSKQVPAAPPLILKDQWAPKRTAASQSALPGLRFDETTVRMQVLDLVLQAIASSAPIKAKDIAQLLRAADARIERSLINSVLHHEGASLVDYDEDTGLFRSKQKH